MRNSERESFRLHARLPVHARRIAGATSTVRLALADVPGPWGVSLSGGKDSVALAHLAHAAGWRGTLFHYWSEEIPPENTAIVLELGQRLDLPVVTVRITGDFDFFAEVGRFLVVAQTDEDRRLMRAHDRRYRGDIQAAVAAHGFAGLFWGLRKDESRARAITIRRYGSLYRAKGRQEWTCHPLAGWSARDVWAYLVTHDLPWLARYDAAEDRERARSETTFQFGLDGALWCRGQGARLRHDDPVLWARLIARFPDLRQWG